MPDLKLFHFDIPTWGNYGDKALFPVVRDAFRVLGSSSARSAHAASDDTSGAASGGMSGAASGGMSGAASDSASGFVSGGEVDFTSAAALRREVDTALVERINARADAVVIGGGGLFLQDTNPNRLSGWQWKISAEALAAIEVPLIIYALGDNRFPGQPEFDELMRSHVGQVLDQSVFFGLRNTGSIETMTKFLGAKGNSAFDSGHSPDHSAFDSGHSPDYGGQAATWHAGPIRFQPCPTSIAGVLYEPLRDRRPDPSQKILAIQMLVHPRQIAAGYDAEVIHQATVDAARMLVAKGWAVLSVPFHPDDAEVSRKLVAEVPEVKEVRLYGSEVGFFAGLDLFSSIPYVLGGRGHAQMIPFGVGSIPISLDLHAKLGYFARDIGHPEFIVPLGPEGLTSEHRDAGEATLGFVADVEHAGDDSRAAHRAHALTERIVATIERAYAQGNDLQDDLASTRQDFLDITRGNHAEIHDALRPASYSPRADSQALSPLTDTLRSGNGLRADVRTAHDIRADADVRTTADRLRTDDNLRTDNIRTAHDIRAEEFHLAAVAEAEEFSTAQTRELSKVRREHRQELDEAATQHENLEAERVKLHEELTQMTTQLEQQSAELDALTAEKNRQTEESVGLQRKLDESKAELRAVNDRTAAAEARILLDKTAHGLTWRARRLKRKFRR